MTPLGVQSGKRKEKTAPGVGVGWGGKGWQELCIETQNLEFLPQDPAGSLRIQGPAWL